MGTAKRERQKQGRQDRLALAERERQRRQRIKSARNFGIIVVVIIAALFFLSRRDSGNKQSVATSSNGSSSTSTSTTTPSVPLPPAGATITGDTPCPPADGSAARTTTFAKAPPTCIDTTKTYTATMVTSKGTITIALDAAAAPVTVNNFVVLARYHYYDGVAFHRVIPGFVDQAGDAVGPTPGMGGPGYTIPDELPTGANPYPEGSLAMANTGSPNTGGSQFFIVIGSGGQQLGPQYSLFGSVTGGLDVAQAINAAGTQSGAPGEVVTITSVTITET